MCRQELEMREPRIYEEVLDRPPAPTCKSVEDSASQDVVYENIDVDEFPEKSEKN